MEPFVVSARKYRPQTFKDVVGQQAITNTLEKAIDHNHLAQALLFCGPRGVGKTTCARILAKKINADSTTHTDEDFAFNIFELDAASNNSVDDIRSLIDQVRIPPQVGKYKVYIIDEVHMLSQSAFNAFLKTLEEPPKHAIFILATTEKHKIIPTILSRCQIFDFKRITVKDAAQYLKYIAEQQGIDADDDALHIIAQKADGAMRDALSIFDRVVSFSGNKLTRKAVTENLNVLDYETYFETTNFILQHDIPSLLLLFNTTLAQGFEGHHFIAGLASHFRDLMVCQHQDTIALLEVGEDTIQQYLHQAQATSNSFLLQALAIANDCDLKFKSSKNQRLLVELTLMQIASINFDGEKKNPESVALQNTSVKFIAPAAFFKDKKATAAVSLQTKQAAVLPKEMMVEPIPSSLSSQERLASDTDVMEAPVEEKALVPEQEVVVPEDKTVTVTEEQPGTEQDKDAIEVSAFIATQVPEVATAPIPTKIDIKVPAKRISGLSISSLKAKKAHELQKKEEQQNDTQLPTSPFTEEEMRLHWANFVEEIDQKGRKILASNLNADIPKLKENHTLWIELPNSTMKKEVEREQYDLMEYLKQKLNNYALSLQITVNEETAKKFAFTPEEKYDKLRAKNPTIDLLRKTFDLDL